MLLESLLAAMEGRSGECLTLVRQFSAAGYVGCEELVYLARQLIHVGEHEEGLARLAEGVKSGFTHVSWFERDAWFDPVRAHPAFEALLAAAGRARDEARAAFRAAGGDELLARAREA